MKLDGKTHTKKKQSIAVPNQGETDNKDLIEHKVWSDFLKGSRGLKSSVWGVRKGMRDLKRGLRPGWQLRLNRVLQRTASYFMTWLTA